MTAECKQAAGLPVKLPQCAACFPMPAFDLTLGPPDEVKRQFTLKPTACFPAAAQIFNQSQATVLPDQIIL